jgi:hypothetical protein
MAEIRARVRRILQAIAAVIGLLTYLWFAAVRLAPSVKRRKAARREAWRNRPRDV